MKNGEDCIGIAVVFLCHDGKNSYLFAKRSKNCRDERDKWDYGGGGIDFGDDIIETLRREIREEYCTDVLDYEFLGYRNVLRKEKLGPTHWITLDFKVLVDPKKVKIGEPHKFDQIGWFKMEDLPGPLHSQCPVFFNKYKERI